MDFKAIGDLRALVAAAIVLCVGGKLAIAQAYQQTNLVSDIQGFAQNPMGSCAMPTGMHCKTTGYGHCSSAMTIQPDRVTGCSSLLA